ncbi:hypothetical protein BH18GEM1_BH18GEM1_08930 [soil metagenome]
MTTTPFFSVVIPTHDRPHELTRCLTALAALRYPPDRYEVIVVDDGSRANLETAVHPFRGRMDLRLLSQENAGPGAARNRGAASARGDVLAFTDDDCAPDPRWLSHFAARFVTDPRVGIGGLTVNALPHNPFATASQLLIDYLYSYFNARDGRVPLFTTNNLALSRGSFLALGGFDETFRMVGGEDRELCDRWVHAGHRLAYAPEAVVLHAHDLDLPGFLRQHFAYGRGARQYHRICSLRGRGRVHPEPVAFYRELVLYPFTRSAERRLPLTALLTLSQVANAAGFFRELLHQRREATRL